MSDNNQLLIEIKTIADLHGVTLTEDALQRIKSRTEQLSEKIDENTRSTGGASDALKRQAQESLAMAVGSDKAAKSLDGLTKSGHSSSRAFYGLKEIIGGIEFNRPGEVFRGINNVLGGLGIGLKTFVTGLSAAAVVAGPLLVLIGAFKQKANENAAAMKRWWDEAAAGAAKYKAESAAVKAAAEADLHLLSSAVEKLADNYSDLISRMDKAAARQKELNSATKDLELAKAKTPEEKAAIEAKYAAHDVQGDASQAGVRKKNAQEALSQADQNIRDAQTSVRDAESEFERHPTRANKEAVDAAKANFTKIREDSGKTIKQASGEVENADQSLKLAGIRKQTLSANTARSVAEKIDIGSREGELRATAEAAQSKGDFGTQDAAVAELRKMHAAARDLRNAVINAGATTADELKRAAKDLELQKQKIKNTRESGS